MKDRVLHVWQQLREVMNRAAEVERRVKAIQQKLDRLDEAFLYAQTIDLTSYERQRDKLREELTLAQIDHHADSIEELDVQSIVAFAERVLPRAADLWGPGVTEDSGSSSCSSLKASGSTEIDSIEPEEDMDNLTDKLQEDKA